MKTIKILCVMMLLIVACATLSACGILSALLDNDSEEILTSTTEPVIETATLTVYDGDAYSSFDVVIGEQANITAYTKSDYYLTGYYTQETGGTKYFDSTGASTGAWQSTNPTTFYAQWDSIYDLEYSVSDIEVFSFSSGGICQSYELPIEFANSILGNLSSELVVSLSFKAKYVQSSFTFTTPTITIQLLDATDSSAEAFGEYKYKPDTDYESHSIQFTTQAKVAKSGELIIDWDSNYSYASYIKDLTITVSYSPQS